MHERHADLFKGAGGTRGIGRSAPLLTALALLVLGLVNWLASIPLVEPEKLGSLGLIDTLPPSMYLAYFCIIAGFAVALSPSLVRTPVPATMLFVLVLFLHLTSAIAYETLRYSWAWKHIGVIDFIMRTGKLDLTSRFLSAYHNWPAFFLLFAEIAKLFRLDALDIANLARFYPTVLNLALLATLPALFRNFTSDARQIWLAVAFFLLGNWIGQDYFSPQGTAYLLYIMVLALMTGPLALGRDRAQEQGSTANRFRNGFAALLALVLIAVIVATHQITPLFLLSSLFLLAFFRRASWGYFAFALIAELFWLTYFANNFVAPLMAELLAEFGRLNGNTLARMANLNVISHGQQIVSIASRSLTGLLALVGAIGVVWHLRIRKINFSALLLMAAPAPVLIATPYGGEILFRVYLFALPLLAYFAAAILYPSEQTAKTPWRTSLAGILLAFMVPLFLLAHNGKDAQYVFSPAEVEAADWLYSNSKPGELLIEGARSYPSQFRNYENFTYVPLSQELPELKDQLMSAPAQLLTRWLKQAPNGGYIVLTKSQKTTFNEMGLLPNGAIDAIEQKLLASAKLKIAYINNDALILTLNPAYHD